MNITGPANQILLRSMEKDLIQKDTRQFQIVLVEDAVSEIINHPLTPALDDGASLRFKNIILRHLARMV